MRLRLFLFINIFVFGFSVHAQVLMPEAYLQQVFGYNQDVRISVENSRAASWAVKSVQTFRLPRLNMDASAQYQFEPSAFGAQQLKNESWNANLTLLQNIYSGSSVLNQLTITRLSQIRLSVAEEATKENVAYTAFMRYWNTSAHFEMQTVSEQFLDLVKQLHAVVEDRFNDGYIARTDLLMLETRIAEAELQLSNAENAYLIANQQLNQFIGLNADSVMQLLPIDSELPLPVRKTIDQALESRPVYRLADIQTQIAAYQTKLVKSEYLPQINVGVQESWGTSFLNVDNSTSFNTIAFANLYVPVFNWNNRKYEIEQARVNELISSYEKSKIKDQVNLEYNHAVTNLNETAKQLLIVKNSLGIAHENLELNTLSYNEGRLPIIDVLSSQLTWLQAYTNLINSNLMNKIAMVDFMKATGMLSE